MTDWYVALPATILLIVLSAFFVIIEFALLAARRHRLEETAETSASSRAVLRSLNELTLMLAGAQLGITVCTFALGAITKPWIYYSLTPLFERLPIPLSAADVISFILALFIVTFLHLVIGEMAPKSWAIAHPESAARTIALPARGFINIFRPLLSWINRMANRLVKATGEVPVERATARGYGADTLQLLVEHSKNTGSLDEASASQISGVIEFERVNIGDVVTTADISSEMLHSSATVEEVHASARKTGHLRILLDHAQGPRVVHVRDTLGAADSAEAAQWSRPALVLDQAMTLQEALEQMRSTNEQIAVVVASDDASDNSVIGVLTWDYILRQLWPNIELQLERETVQRDT